MAEIFPMFFRMIFRRVRPQWDYSGQWSPSMAIKFALMRIQWPLMTGHQWQFNGHRVGINGYSIAIRGNYCKNHRGDHTDGIRIVLEKRRASLGHFLSTFIKVICSKAQWNYSGPFWTQTFSICWSGSRTSPWAPKPTILSLETPGYLNNSKTISNHFLTISFLEVSKV